MRFEVRRLVGAILILLAMTAPARADTWRDQVVDGMLPQSLTGEAGNAARGRALVAGRRGNCLACHTAPIPEQRFHGNLGPDLQGVATRLSPGALRLRLVDSTRINPDSIMPPLFRRDGLVRVRRDRRGQTILSAREIEDVLAYLLTLDSPP